MRPNFFVTMLKTANEGSLVLQAHLNAKENLQPHLPYKSQSHALQHQSVSMDLTKKEIFDQVILFVTVSSLTTCF
jgi:hypothetical protein